VKTAYKRNEPGNSSKEIYGLNQNRQFQIVVETADILIRHGRMDKVAITGVLLQFFSLESQIPISSVLAFQSPRFFRRGCLIFSSLSSVFPVFSSFGVIVIKQNQ